MFWIQYEHSSGIRCTNLREVSGSCHISRVRKEYRQVHSITNDLDYLIQLESMSQFPNEVALDFWDIFKVLCVYLLLWIHVKDEWTTFFLCLYFVVFFVTLIWRVYIKLLMYNFDHFWTMVWKDGKISWDRVTLVGGAFNNCCSKCFCESAYRIRF